MLTILTTKDLYQMLKFGWVLLLLLIVSACSRNNDLPKPAKVTQIQFKENTIQVGVGKSTGLQVLHTPAELNAPMYEWFVLNPDVAKVENGMLHGLSVGETVLAVTAKGFNLTARTKIRVVPVLPQGLHLQAEKTSLLPGEETLIDYTIDPQDVTDADQLEIEWSSSDEAVCKVARGKVIAIGAGAADVVAQIKGTTIKGSLRIQVALVPVESISFSLQQVSVIVGEGKRLAPRILPANATDQRLIWTSADSQVARVIDGTVLGIKEGATTIQVTTIDGQKTATCLVTVKPIQIERVIFPIANLALVVGQDYHFEATVLPEQAKDKSLKWSSSNISVATVDQRGRVVAVGKGTAIISAIAVTNPRVQAACQVIVVNPEDMVITQVSATSKVSVNGYVSANLSALIENGYLVPVRLISFEVLSHSGEVILGNYQAPIVSPSMQYRHTCTIKNIYRPYIRYMFELNGRRYERRVEISL
jgi:uncharacterized protein YjdB